GPDAEIEGGAEQARRTSTRAARQVPDRGISAQEVFHRACVLAEVLEHPRITLRSVRLLSAAVLGRTGRRLLVSTARQALLVVDLAGRRTALGAAVRERRRRYRERDEKHERCGPEDVPRSGRHAATVTPGAAGRPGDYKCQTGPDCARAQCSSGARGGGLCLRS